MGMNSWEEDELFRQWGWEKDLIGRFFRGPHGHKITFDQVMGASQDEEGEEALKATVARYGVRMVDAER